MQTIIKGIGIALFLLLLVSYLMRGNKENRLSYLISLLVVGVLVWVT